MASVSVDRRIKAPIDRVFRTISEIEHFSQAVPGITKVEIVSEVKSGVGTRFRETRVFKGREATEELEVTEYVPNERVRILADSHGSEWDSLYTLAREDGETLLTLTMEARPHTFMARLLSPLMSSVVRKALESDMDSVKEWCEREG